MDRFNKLWGEHGVQRGVLQHRWGRTFRCQNSKRHQSTRAANSTRACWTWTHTPSLQELVSNMCSKQRTGRQPPTTTQQTTSRTIRLLFLQNTWRKGNNTNPHRHWRGNRHEHGSSCQQQDSRLSISRPMHTNIPHGVWQSTSCTQQHNPTVRSGGSPHSTSQSNSS